ncbi:small ribosomal subunit protein uS14-like [Bos javanicus]|uniref:small ribosomal subunit protein uS14-like n=1 Tax=Bos javanicus TaxID=9906 RepID=UPI002AA94C4C|nr:small ribosomal subunit protein uS14-like [Bos javanicus]
MYLVMKVKSNAVKKNIAQESNVGHQQLYWGHLRKFSEGSRSCRVCSNRHGLIRKHCLNMGHQYMKDVGFVKSD